MATVRFEVEADMASAIQSLLKVKDAQDKVVGGFEKVGRSGKKTDSTIGGMVGNLGKLAAGYISFQGLKMGAEAWTQAMGAAGDKIVGLQSDLAGLMTEGENAFKMPAVRE